MRFIVHALCQVGLVGCGVAHAGWADTCSKGSGEPKLIACTTILTADPNNFDALSYRGVAHFQLGQRERAISDFSAAIALRPKSASAYYHRGRVNYPYDLDAAFADYSTAIALNPKVAAFWSDRGGVLWARNNFVGAVADLLTAIKLNPKLDTAHNTLGVVYHGMGEFEKALKSLSKAIDLAEGKRAEFYSNRGNLLSDMGKSDIALTDLSKAIEIDPKFVAAYQSRANAHRRLGKLAEAIADCSKVILLKPVDGDGFACRSRMMYEAGHFSGALDDAEHAVVKSKNSAFTFGSLAYAYLGINNPTRAVIESNRALSLQPDSVWCLVGRGQAYEALGLIALAKADYQYVVGVKPTSFERREAQSLANERLKNLNARSPP